ncbi:MAG: DUF3617 domain-containing protein [Leptospirillia bacterium]
MRKWASLLVLPGLILLAGTFSRAGAETSPPFKKGEWKIEAVMTMVSESPGMPSMPGRHSSVLECLTSHHLVPEKRPKMSNKCTFSKHLAGNTLFTNIQCGNQETKGQYTYEKTSFHGKSVTLIKGAMPMRMETRFKGHYVGPCPHS